MKKRKINHTPALGLLAGLLLTIFTANACVAQGIKGDGNVMKQERSVGSFNGIEVGGAFKVFLTQGDNEAVVVEADQNLLDIIETEVRGNTLKITARKDIRNSEALNVYVTFKDLGSLDVSGACNLSNDGKLKLGDLDLDCSGASDVELKMSASAVTMDCSGASHMDLYGMAETLVMDISGASSVDASDFEVKTCEAEVSGASHGKVFVTGELSAEVSGAGSLKYKGDAVIKDPEVSGAGSLKKL